MKVCEKCETEIYTKDGDNRCPTCESGTKKAKERKRAAAKAKREALASLGLTRVRGALGGIYYE